jgi:hypothetical protein
VVPIADWDRSYSFGVGQSRFDDEPYSEHGHLRLIGAGIRPSRIKAETVEVFLMPEYGLNRERREAHKPDSVGSIHISRGRAEILLPVPASALGPLLQMLSDGRFKFVSLHGDVLQRGRARIRSYRLEMHIDEGDND